MSKKTKIILSAVVLLIVITLIFSYYQFFYQTYQFVSNDTEGQSKYRMKLVDKSIEYCGDSYIVQLHFFYDVPFMYDVFRSSTAYFVFKKDGESYMFDKGVIFDGGKGWQKVSRLTSSGKLTLTNAWDREIIENMDLKTDQVLISKTGPNDDPNFLGHELKIKKLVFGKNDFSVDTFICPQKNEWDNLILKELFE